MIDHGRMQQLAGNPEIIEDLEELWSLMAHVKVCLPCSERLDKALEFDAKFLAPLRKGFHHLSGRSLKRLRRSGFVPGSRTSETMEEWHVTVCQQCAERFHDRTKFVLTSKTSRWAAAAAGLLFLVFISLLLWHSQQRVTQTAAVLRSSTTLALLAPDDGATIRVFQEFRCQAVGSVQEYNFIISDVSGSLTKIQERLTQPSFVLDVEDANQLTDGAEYVWYVTAKSGPLNFISEKRRFRFSKAHIAVGYSSFPAVRRNEMERRSHEGNNEVVSQLMREVKNYLDHNRHGTTLDTAWLLKIQGDSLLRLDEIKAAIASYRKSIALSEELGIPDGMLYVKTLNNYALAAQESGDLEAALGSYVKALTILRAQDDKAYLKTRSDCLLNLGTLRRDLGQPDPAIKLYEEALEVDKGLGDPGRVAEDLNNIGNLLVDEFEDPKQGIKYLEEALALHTERTRQKGVPLDSFADTLDSLGFAYALFGQPLKALSYYERALKVDGDRGNFSGMLSSTNNVANLFADDLNDPSAALSRYREALKMVERKKDLSPDEIWRTYDGLGSVYLRLGQFGEAEQYITKAIDIVRSLRTTLGEQENRRSFNANRTHPYFDLAFLRIRQQNHQSLFEAIELARAAGLREIRGNGSRIVPQPLRLEDMQHAFNDDDVAVEYFWGAANEPLLLVAATKHTCSGFQIARRRALEAQIKTVIDDLTNGREDEASRARHGELVRQLFPNEVLDMVRQSHAGRIIISPDGILHHLPFEMLRITGARGGTEFLLTDHVVSTAPSLSWWRAMQQVGSPVNPEHDVLVVGDPIVAKSRGNSQSALVSELVPSSFSPLPWSRKEAEIVASFGAHNPVKLLGAESTLSRFMALPHSDFRVIHFATHASSSGTLETSFLLFGCNPLLDVLRGPGVLNLGLSGQLVVLSACNTNVGNSLSIEGTDSLAYAFLLAGARCVVATRWPVKDANATALMSNFYEQLYLGSTVDQALRKAKLGVMKSSGSNPTWAAFTSIGYGDMTVPISPTLLLRTKVAVRLYWLRTLLVALGIVVVLATVRIFKRDHR